MIRGPVLPHVRESLWALIAPRLATLEQGLSLVAEGLDCAGGQLGLCEGLARDAIGAPVLVLLAVDGDPLLAARIVAACEFLARVGDALVAAVPEGSFCAGAPGRVVVVGTDAAAASLETIRRLPFPALAVCRLEPFRLGSSERFAVRWLPAAPAAEPARAAPAPVELVVPPAARAEWDALRALCERIDPAVQIDGDRYLRRITWRGRLLGEVVTTDGQLRGGVADGPRQPLDCAADVRRFADQLIRRFASVAGLGQLAVSEPAAESPRPPLRAGRPEVVEGLRAAAAAARLSAEEYAALGGPVRGTGGDADAVEGGLSPGGFEGHRTAPRPD